MPILGNVDNMETHKTGSHFAFSATKIAHLGASEYTLVCIAVDCSGSLEGLESELEAMLGKIVQACRDPRNPRADNMMLRVILFNDSVTELHGFKPVMDINPGDYKGKITCTGLTAARDAAFNAVKSCSEYGAQLVAQQFAVNGAVFLITDGIDNRSRVGVKMLADEIKSSVRSESLESMLSALVGIGSGSSADVSQLSQELLQLKDDAGFSQYEFAGDATPATLARIGGFVSKSASSQSQSLGTGGPSQCLKI